jgi:hypothetical protein
MELRLESQKLFFRAGGTTMTQPTKWEQLAGMRLEDFKEHLRSITGGSPEQISGKRPNRLLVRNRKKAAERRRR